MRLFRSKYRARIEAKIKELQFEWWKISDYKIASSSTKEYTKNVVRQGDLSAQIKLLKDLLL